MTPQEEKNYEEKWKKEFRRRYAVMRQHSRAHGKISNALKTKKLKKSLCVVCTSEKNIVAHHFDYSKPLEIIWLCASCHQKVHNLWVGYTHIPIPR